MGDFNKEGHYILVKIPSTDGILTGPTLRLGVDNKYVSVLGYLYKLFPIDEHIALCPSF